MLTSANYPNPILFPDAFKANHKRILRFWSAARATIVFESVPSLSPGRSPEQQTVQFAYTYVEASGITVERTLTMKRKRVWQRGLAVGSSFTVLYDPESAHAVSVPYFDIRDAEIFGAVSAKVTPS